MGQDDGVDAGVGDRQLGQARQDVGISGFDACIGYDGMTSRPTTGQQSIADAPSSQLKQLPAENIVQGFRHELGFGL
jgi:hypothetical protein